MFKIIPGVSGSLLAVGLGIYEEVLDKIQNIFYDFNKNILYLSSLGVGFLIAIVFCSSIIDFFITNYYFITIFLFIGMMIGTTPQILKKIEINSKIDYIYIIIPFIFIILLCNNSNVINFKINNFFVIILGFIEASTTIIPGISGTTVNLLFGSYEFLLELYQNLFNYKYIINNYNLIINYLIGLILGIFLMIKIVSILLKNYTNQFYLVITGLFFASILMMLGMINFNNFNILNLLISIIGFVVVYKLDNSN